MEFKNSIRWQPISLRAVAVILVAYCAVGAVAVVAFSGMELKNPWENTYFESPQTYSALHAVQTGKLYIPMSEAPHTPQAYTPLYYAIDAVVAWFAHLQVDRFVFYARALTFLAYLLSGFLVFLICRVTGIRRDYSILAALMMLGQPDFLGWNVSPRPDMLYLLFMLLSLLCAVVWSDRIWLGCGLAGFLGGIAFLIKQPGLTVVAAIFVVLALKKQFREVSVLCVGTLVPAAIVFGVLYQRGDPFLQQLSFVRNSLWSVSDTLHFSATHLFSWYWLVPAAIGFIGLIRAIRSENYSSIVVSFAVMNWLMGFATLPQVGGYLNYLLPGLVGSSLLLPYAIDGVQECSRSISVLAVVGTALVLATWSGFNYARDLSHYFHPPAEDSLNWLRPYRVLSDLTTMNMHGRDPELLDPFGAHVLELTGHWDATPLIDNLKQGKYDLIIFTRVNLFHVLPSFRGISYLGPAETKALNENYVPLCSTTTSLVMRPKVRAVPIPPEVFSHLFERKCRVSPPGHRFDLVMAWDSR